MDLRCLCLLLCIVTVPDSVTGFYVPGVAPVEFGKSDTVEVKVQSDPWLYIVAITI